MDNKLIGDLILELADCYDKEFREFPKTLDFDINSETVGTSYYAHIAGSLNQIVYGNAEMFEDCNSVDQKMQTWSIIKDNIKLLREYFGLLKGNKAFALQQLTTKHPKDGVSCKDYIGRFANTLANTPGELKSITI